MRALPKTRTGNGLLPAICLGIALLIISLARLTFDQAGTTFNVDIVRNTMGAPLWRTRLGFNFAVFAAGLTALHIALGLCCWFLARASQLAFPAVPATRTQWTALWFIAAAGWVLLANAALFPASSLGEPYHELASQDLADMPLFALLGTLLAVAVALTALLATYRTRSYRVAVASTIVIAGCTGLLAWQDRPGMSSPPGAPNIIFLGIDSLRPDFIDAETTPNLHAFMEGSIRFNDTVTPLARTFPSWISILTGRHPHTTGALMNLLPRENIRTGATLPQLLRDHGYVTYYATDETRFANIDESFGFDRVLTPGMGGSDFLLSRLADTPLSNLLVNTRLGGWLFPHIHTNRAAHLVYDPDSFIDRLRRGITAARPVFLAAHLTLPHWPFTWARSNSKGASYAAQYGHAVIRTDAQFGELVRVLEDAGVLQNAIVVLLSDHGEALGPDDFLSGAFPLQTREATSFQQWGHGTSVFSPSQYRVVLAFRGFGDGAKSLGPASGREAPVSLLDVAPTILDLLGLDSTEEFDGKSLAAMLESSGGAGVPDDRIRFTESEYNPQGFNPADFTTSQLVSAARIYRLDPSTDRVTVRPDMLGSIMSSRQYAALLGNRAMGAAVPGIREDGRHEFIFVPLIEGHADTASDAERLRKAIQQRFGIELGPTILRPAHAPEQDRQQAGPQTRLQAAAGRGDTSSGR